jgi:Flp pilus assembly protein TadD
LLVYVAVLALLLAASRTGLAAGVAAVGLWLALSERRVEGALLGLAGAVPAVGLAAWAFTRPALVDDGQSSSDRVRDGAVFAVLALAGAAVVAVLVVWGLRRGLRRRQEAGRALGLGAAGAAAVAFAALLLAVGNPVSWAADRFADDTAAANDPTRLGSLSSNNRTEWWGEAWEVFRADPLAGAGAATFEIARKRYRDSAVDVTQPHSVPLQVLADGGVVGLVLLLALVASGAAVLVAVLRRLGGEERAAVVALAVLPAAWLLHGLADYDLDFLAVTAPPLFALGVLSSAGQAAVRVRRPRWAVAAVAVALVAFGALAAPPLAERGVETSLRALERGDFERAADAADLAGTVDPFSLEPPIARARVAQLRGDEAAALDAYADAVRLQPENPEPWALLGTYELSLGDECTAYRHLNEAYTLDPSGRRWAPGGPLDVARDAVNAGACER